VNHDKEWFITCLKDEALVEKLKKISLIISDIDGCLTDGKAFYSDSKEIVKNFSIQDGYLMAKCNKDGLPALALISGRSDTAARKRAQVLGIPDHLYYEGVDKNKCVAVEEVQAKVGVKKEETLFFGDDLLDLATKPCVSLLVSPSNALFYIHSNSDIVVPRAGGNGALRLVLDLILYVQKKHIAQECLEKALSL